MNFDFREILKSELARRLIANPSYSLRAFARDIRVTPPQLSAVMSGKKGLSKARARAIARFLGLSKSESELFVAAISAEHARSRAEKQLAQKQVERLINKNDFSLVQEARFRVIADWYHFAILQLAETKGFKWSPVYISHRLGISQPVTEKALGALEQSGFIVKKSNGYQKAEAFIKTEDVPSRAIRTYHHQILSKATEAIEEQSIHERDFSSVMVAIDHTQIPRLKEWIQSFREEFCAEAGKGSGRDEVYTLSLQFFKLSKNKPKQKEEKL